jgi:coenzyme PQQ biosynthesis protein PqqD
VSLTIEAVLERPSDVRYRRVGDEWVVLRQASAEVLVLNEWAGRVLDLLDGKRTLSDIAEALGQEYAAEPETIRRDVLHFASEIRDTGLAEVRSSEVVR